MDSFRQRLNAAANSEESGLATRDGGLDNWLLGQQSRNLGALHSDFWRGTAVDLSRRSAIAVYPVGGWWKENPPQHRYNRKVRYSLIVSIRALSSSIDIYTPVQVQIDMPISVEV